MTAKEKAKELYDKMLQWQTDGNIYIQRNITSTSAKHSALIAVDEMISVLPFTAIHRSLNEYAIQMHKYLEKVKEEIEKL